MLLSMYELKHLTEKSSLNDLNFTKKTETKETERKETEKKDVLPDYIKY